MRPLDRPDCDQAVARGSIVRAYAKRGGRMRAALSGRLAPATLAVALAALGLLRHSVVRADPLCEAAVGSGRCVEENFRHHGREGDLQCGAATDQDISLSDVQVKAGELCDGTPGDSITFTASLTTAVGKEPRYNVGWYFATGEVKEGSSRARKFPYEGECNIFTFPCESTEGSPPGVDNGDTCGDISGEQTIPVEITANCVKSSDGALALPYCLAWADRPEGSVCTQDPFKPFQPIPKTALPGSPSACSCMPDFVVHSVCTVTLDVTQMRMSSPPGACSQGDTIAVTIPSTAVVGLDGLYKYRVIGDGAVRRGSFTVGDSFNIEFLTKAGSTYVFIVNGCDTKFGFTPSCEAAGAGGPDIDIQTAEALPVPEDGEDNKNDNPDIAGHITEDTPPWREGNAKPGEIQLIPAFAGKDLLITILLLAAIVALALLPSGSSLQGQSGAAKPPHDVAPEVEMKYSRGVDKDPLEEGELLPKEPSSAAQPATKPTTKISKALLPRCVARAVFAANFTLWLILAMAFNVYSKAYLRSTRNPVGLLFLQGAGGVIVLGLFWRAGVVDLRADLSPPAARRLAMAAFGHSSQALFTNFAVYVGGVAVTNALKALEPVAAAVLSYAMLKKTVSATRFAALLAVVAGILTLTWKGKGGGADHIVLSAAFTFGAVVGNAFRNVVLKSGTPIPPFMTLFACSAAATVAGTAILLLRIIGHGMDDLLGYRIEGGSETSEEVAGIVRFSGVLSSLCYVGFQFASFNLLAFLTPVAHAIGNSVKRVFVFGTGILLLGEMMTARQLGGVAIAMLGVLGYGLAGTK